MKQTAVEFLLENIEKLIKQGHTFNHPIFKYYFIQEAKEMEKEQIIHAYEQGTDFGINDGGEDSENYYNDTFKKKNK
jgi:hypothetical protein